MKIELSSLTSRAVRKQITGSNTGIRKIDPGNSTPQKNDQGGIIGWIVGSLGRFTGWLISAAFSAIKSLVSWSLTTLWGWVVQSAQFLWNFDWNKSDEDMMNDVKGSFDALGGVLGGALGNAIGWLACGVLPSVAIMAFNEPLGVYVLKNVGEEALREMAANLGNVVRASSNVAAKAAFTWSYIKVRERLIGRSGYLTDEEIAEKVKSKEWTQETADKNKLGRDAAKSERKPWSFAKKTEEFIEAIPNTFWRNFAEEMLEEAGEACIEAGYAVASSIDAYVAAQKIASEGLLGANQTVQITMNRSLTGTTPTTTQPAT